MIHSVIASEATQSIAQQSWIASSQALLAMTNIGAGMITREVRHEFR
jgi:hypothetical protein